MAKTSIYNLKREILYFLRNQDILSTTEREVVTATDTGSFSADSTHLINRNNIKNVRSVTVGGSPLTYGDDYTYDMDFDDAGTIKCKITFTSPQTGAYSIPYDYGTDRIFPDFPQPHLKLSSFPRIGFDIISGTTAEHELGAGSNFTEYMLSIVAYDKDQDDVEALIASVRGKIQDNKKNFFYSPFVTPTAMGPLLVSEFGKNKILQRNQDVIVRFVYED